MTIALLGLHLRSRRAGWTTLLIVITALLRRILLPWTSTASPFTTLVALLLIAAAATVITTGLASPFGETEHCAGGPLPALRLTHLTGSALVAAAAFTVVATWAGQSVTEYLRDLAGLTGLTLLAGTLLGAQRCWIPPLGYTVLCATEQDLHHTPLWAWPLQPTNHTTTLIATGLLALGIATTIPNGLPHRD